MTSTRNICAICAWREMCQKKFSVSGKDIRCPDFVKDITLENKKKDKKSVEEQNSSPKTGIDK